MFFLLMSCYMLVNQNYLFKTFFTLQSTTSFAKLEIKVLIQMPNPTSLYQRNILVKCDIP